MKKALLSRRLLLRGAGGIAIGLPLLEAMIPRIAHGATGTPPRRFVGMSFPDGTYQGRLLNPWDMSIWQPQNPGALTAANLPPVLSPLRNNLGDFNVLGNINNRTGDYGEGAATGGHNRAMRSFLTSSVATSTTTVDIGPSIDQFYADQIAKTTTLKQHSLVFGTMASTKAQDAGPIDYMNHISYRNRQAVSLLKNPRMIFDSLFAGVENPMAPVRAASMHASILDFVRSDTTALINNLGSADKARVDEYLTNVRELERRVVAAENAPVSSCKVGTAPSSALTGEYQNTLGTAFTDEVNALVDITATAFACDFARTATIVLAGESHNINYGGVGFTPYEGANMAPGRHIDSAHHDANMDKIRRLISIHQYEVTFFKRLLDKLKATTESNGTMLDNSLVLYGCGLADGLAHNFSNIALLVGGKAGGVQAGRFLKPAAGTNLSNVHLEILQRLGVSKTSWGDGRGASTGNFNMGA